MHKWYITACVFPLVEYVHSMTCSCRLPRHIESIIRCPTGHVVYPTALIRYGLWYTNLWRAGRMKSSSACVWSRVLGLSSWKHSCFGRRIWGRFVGIVSCMSVLRLET